MHTFLVSKNGYTLPNFPLLQCYFFSPLFHLYRWRNRWDVITNLSVVGTNTVSYRDFFHTSCSQEGRREQQPNILPSALCPVGAKVNGFEDIHSFLALDKILFCLPTISLVKKRIQLILKALAPLIGKRLFVACHRLVVSCGKKKNLHTLTSICFWGPSFVLSFCRLFHHCCVRGGDGNIG